MNIANDIIYVGVNDREIDLFEGQYKVHNGMSYNSYLIMDDKIAVMDSVDSHFTAQWLENIRNCLGDRKPTYLVVQHMEPDHSASIMDFLNEYPDAVVIASAIAFKMIFGFFGTSLENNRIVVGNNGSLSLGKHELVFLTAPMVHWPEVIVTYDKTENVLFSADAFGKFGALDTDEEWDGEARRYYIGIVGKYGAQVQSLLKKASELKIDVICPLHGPVITDNIAHCVELYNVWSSYTPEDAGVTIAYTSVYGHTKKAVKLLESNLKANGCNNVKVYDLARCDMSQAVASAFRYSKLVLATTTYNTDIFPFMKQYIDNLTERGYKNRTVAMIENGTWAPQAVKVMKGLLAESVNIKYSENNVTIISEITEQNKDRIKALADELCEK